MREDSFVGTWRLVSFEFRTADGQAHRPFGEDAEGYIMYNEDGFMSVAFMAADRSLFASNDPRGGTVEEKAAAMEGFFSYCGRYQVRDGTVVHHIEVSSFPNWKGVDQERYFAFHGNRLTLSTPPMLVGGVELTGHLIWERV
jgi:hypothetical protein